MAWFDLAEVVGRQRAEGVHAGRGVREGGGGIEDVRGDRGEMGEEVRSRGEGRGEGREEKDGETFEEERRRAGEGDSYLWAITPLCFVTKSCINTLNFIKFQVFLFSFPTTKLHVSSSWWPLLSGSEVEWFIIQQV